MRKRKGQNKKTSPASSPELETRGMTPVSKAIGRALTPTNTTTSRQVPTQGSAVLASRPTPSPRSNLMGQQSSRSSKHNSTGSDVTPMTHHPRISHGENQTESPVASTARPLPVTRSTHQNSPQEPAYEKAALSTQSTEPAWVQTLLSKMDSLHSELSRVTSRVTSLETEIRGLHLLNQRVAEIEHSMNHMNDYFESVRREMKTEQETFRKMEDQVRFNTDTNRELRNRLADLESRSMRDNLVFAGIDERPGENSEEVVCEMIKNQLGIERPVSFERVHRIGAPNTSNTRPRPIVAKFSSFKDRELVRTSSHRLRGKPIRIHEQYGREVAEKRKALYPKFKQAREEGKFAKFTYDSLVVDNQRFRLDERGNVVRDPSYNRPAPPKRYNNEQPRTSPTSSQFVGNRSGRRSPVHQHNMETGVPRKELGAGALRNDDRSNPANNGTSA